MLSCCISRLHDVIVYVTNDCIDVYINETNLRIYWIFCTTNMAYTQMDIIRFKQKI